VPVGKVELIGFDAKVKGNVLIRISIDRGAPVTKATFATVASQGVTGLGFIQLDDDGTSNERLQSTDGDYPRIPLKPGSLDKLLKQSDAIFSQAEQVTARLNRLLSDENQAALSTTLVQLGESATALNRLAKGLEPAIASLSPLSLQASATLKDASATLKETSAAMKKADSAIASVKTASDEVAATARRINEKGGPLDTLAEGGAALAGTVETFSATTLPRLAKVADESTRTLRQLRRTVNAVDDNPQALIFGNGPPLPGPGEPGFTASPVAP
jgi:phospholipid/cholesterol/gamma-HCH transport system substrate-binding protein